MTMLDYEVNTAYTRQRVAEIRAMSDDRFPGPATTVSRQPVLASVRLRLGAGLIAIGERLGGVSMPRQSTPTPGRLPS